MKLERMMPRWNLRGVSVVEKVEMIHPWRADHWRTLS
jgi:hypothetical protein